MTMVTQVIAAQRSGDILLVVPHTTLVVSRLVDDVSADVTRVPPQARGRRGRWEHAEAEYPQHSLTVPSTGCRDESGCLGVTKRDRIPPAHRDWLARLCLQHGTTRIADRLFPRLAPLARDQALCALLASEANGDAYLVGRDPCTGELGSLPPLNSADSAVLGTLEGIMEPQRFRIYWFASESPLDLAGDWRSIKVWSLRWQEWTAWPQVVAPPSLAVEVVRCTPRCTPCSQADHEEAPYDIRHGG